MQRTLWQTNITMENHHFQWENIYKLSFSIAMLNYQMVYRLKGVWIPQPQKRNTHSEANLVGV